MSKAADADTSAADIDTQSADTAVGRALSQPARLNSGSDPTVGKAQDLSDKLGDAHLNILPKRQLITCLLVMSLGLFASFADQTSVTVALPVIAQSLNAETTINWAGTAALLANCVCQVLFGRFADIFGRKTVFLLSLVILGVADLACLFAQTGVQFYVFRAFAGIGAGGVQSLTMVIVSDIVTLKQRGKYQGALGTFVGLGNAVGPFIMAGFIQKLTWRAFYWFMTPLIAVIFVTVWWFLDGRQKELESVLASRREKFKRIDYLGSFFSTLALTLLLIPISGGGSTYAWNSSLVIAMFAVGGLCFVGFLLIEWKVPRLPMIPLRLFRSPLLCVILSSNLLYGMAYYGFLYYVPYYYQIVRGLDAVQTSVLLLPLVIPQSVMSTVAGMIISFTGHYYVVMYVGYASWTLGCGLLLLWHGSTSYGVIVVTLLIMGVGVGFIFQPMMVAAQAHARKADRLVVIGTRNVMRSFGGALGIAVSSLIVTNSLLKEIDAQLGLSVLLDEYLAYMREHIYSHISTTALSRAQVEVVRLMYMTALQHLFYLMVPLLGLCLVTSVFVKDRGLQCIDEIQLAEKDSVGDGG